MFSPATSIPISPLPFGADNTSHTAWQRSHSARGSTHRNVEGINKLYEDAPKPSTYPAFIAAAQASDVASHRASASIAPSSLNDLPHRIKKVVKRHNTQLWVLAVMFQLNVVALTIGVTLGATSAHSLGEGATQVAAIVLGITGFVCMISSLALGWLIWNGRQARARLEKKWVDEEEVKESRSLREKDREGTARANIRERERSLSRNRSVSRGRQRDSACVLPSFRELTLSPPPKGSDEANADVPSNPRKGKERMPDLRPTLATVYSSNAVAQAESQVANEQDRGSNYTHYLDLNNSSEEDIPPMPAVDKGKQLESANVPTVPELPASEPTAGAAPATASEPEPNPAMQDRQLEKETLKQWEEYWTTSPQPVKESSSTVHEPNPASIAPSPAHEHADTSTILGSSPTLLNSTPISGPTPTPIDQELIHLNTALINAFRPTATPVNSTPREAQFPSPLSQQHAFPTPVPSPRSGLGLGPAVTAPITPFGQSLRQSGARRESIQRAENIMRLGHGLLDSTQSDANFQTMIGNSGSESGDEDTRQYGREKSRERVSAWAANQIELRGRRADSEERREGWRGRLRLARRASRDAESEMAGKRRSASVGAVVLAGGGGEGSGAGSSRPGRKHIADLMKKEGRKEGR